MKPVPERSEIQSQNLGLIIALIAILLIVSACAGAALEPPQSASPIDEPSADSAAAQDQPVANTESSQSEAEAPVFPVAAEPTESYKGIPVGFTAEGLPYRGSPDAPVVMVEYSDYQCPFCSRYFVQTEPALDEAYVRDGRVRVVFSDFPLQELHPNAPSAHVAANCVAEQGSASAYWDMHSALFRSVADWQNVADPNVIFSTLIEDLEIDTEEFATCINDPAQLELVNQRVDYAGRLGYSGTPSFQFIRRADGESFQLVGAQPFDEFANILDSVIAGEMPNTAESVESSQETAGSAEIPFWATAEGLAPDPDRPGYNMAGDQFRGNLDAAVTIIEFSDFQCPYCRRHYEDTQPVLDQRFIDSGEVLWTFKHFPLNIHPQAIAAGAAAECAAEQGEFWAMHGLLFGDQSRWSTTNPAPIFIELADQIGLDTDSFAACLDSDEIVQRVNSDLQEGMQFVRGTPTFIIIRDGKGSIVPGALPADRFTEILEQVISEVSTN